MRMRRYIFAPREKEMIQAWLESESENPATRNLFTKVKQNLPQLTEDTSLMLRLINTLRRQGRWTSYTSTGTPYGSAYRRAEHALTHLKNEEAT